MKGCWTLSHAFSASINDHMNFIFYFVNVACHVYCFGYIEPFLHPRDKSYLMMVYDSFNILLNSACSHFVENFSVYVHQRYWPVVFFFLVVFLSGLVSW